MKSLSFSEQLFLGIALVIPALALFKGIGVVIRRFLPYGPLSHPSLDFVHGLLLTVFVTGISIAESFSTLWVIPLYILLCCLLPGENNVSSSTTWWTGILIVIGFYLLFITHSLVFTFRTPNTLNMPYIDEFFYIKLTDQISNWGIETNSYRIPWGYTQDGKSIYHYFEIWTSVFFHKALCFNAMFVFRYATFPIFLALSSFHFFSSFTQPGKSKWFIWFVASWLPILGAFTTFEMMEIPFLPHTLRVFLTYLSDYIPANRLKLSTVLLFLSMTFYLWKQRKTYYFWPLFLVIFFWPLTAHSIALSFGVLLLLSPFSIPIKLKVIGLGFAGGLVLYFASLYGSKGTISSDGFNIFLRYKSPRLIFGTIFYNLLAFGLSVMPSLIFGLVYRKKIQSFDMHLLVAVALALLCGATTNALTVGMVDSFQFFINLAAPIIALVLAHTLVEIQKSEKPIIWIAFSALFLGYQGFAFTKIFHNNMQNFNLQYSIQYIDRLKNFGDGSFRGVSLLKPDGYFKGVPSMNQTGSFFYFYPNSCVTPINNAENLSLNSEETIRYVNLQGPFLDRFSKSGVSDTSDFRIDFIEKQKVDFLVVEKSKNISSYPELETIFKLDCVDSTSGEKLYIRRNLPVKTHWNH